MRRRRLARASQYESDAYRELQFRLSSNARRLREEKRWSQEEAADRCAMATRLLQRVESGKVNLTLTTLARLCEGFEVDVIHLLAPPHSPMPARRRSMGVGRPTRIP